MKKFLAAAMCSALLAGVTLTQGAEAATFTTTGTIGIDHDERFTAARDFSCGQFDVECLLNTSRSIVIDAGDTKTTTVEIAGFDSSLGTLTGVRLTTSVASSFLRVTETGDFNGQKNMTLFSDVDTSGSGSAILNARSGGLSNSISLGSDVQGGNNSFIPAASDMAFRSNNIDVLLNPFREDKVQIEFESIFAVDGIVSCKFDVSIRDNRLCGGGLRQRYAASSTSTSSGNELQVTYNVVYEYTPFEPEPPSAVPLPAGFPMLLTALGFFGLRRFRR